MSWIEHLNKDLIIRTGEGSEFRPPWMNAKRTRGFNTSEFEFRGREGTLVRREQPKGRRYELEIYFRGEDNIEQAEAFDEAAKDPRPWEIDHPYYGALLVQPLSLSFDNTMHNVTMVTGKIVETIRDKGPTAVQDPAIEIGRQKSALDESTIADYSEAKNPSPSFEDVNDLEGSVNDVFNAIESKISNTLDLQKYKNAYNEANSAVLSAIDAPGTAIDRTISLFTAPARFASDVQSRVQIIEQQFDKLRDRFIGSDPSPSSKRNYETLASACVSAHCLAVSTPKEGDYPDRQSVFSALEGLTTLFDQYITDINDLQTPNAGVPNGYVPSHDIQFGLNEIFNRTISSLFQIALETAQERTFVLSAPSSIILLTKRLYGLDADDENIDLFMRQNGIGLNEILEIPAGREITYFV